MTADYKNIIRLDKSHIEPAVAVLDRAFEDYPLLVAFIPDESERKRKTRYIFEYFIRYGLLYGEVYATSPKLEGIVMWLTSGKADFPLWRMTRCGVIPFVFRLGIKTISRMMSVGDFITSIHKSHAPFPHLYVWYFGVAPEFQGKGYSKILLKAMFARADSRKLPCYLEAHTKENVAFWSRHGFKVNSETIIPHTEVIHWAMLRKKVV